MPQADVWLGTMFYGSTLSESSCLQQLRYAFDQGIICFDTATMYPVPSCPDSVGMSEHIIGKWLSSLSHSDRQKINILSKYPNYSHRLPYLRPDNSFVVSYDELKSSLTNTLKRLGLSSISRYLLHWPSRSTINFGSHFLRDHDPNIQLHIDALAETISNLFRLVQDGLVENIGLSNETSLGVSTALSTLSLKHSSHSLTVQNPYSLISTLYELTLEEVCHAYNIYFMAHSPLAFGQLSAYPRTPGPTSRDTLHPKFFTRYHHPYVSTSVINAYSAIAHRHHMPLPELAYRYLLSNPTVKAIVIGASSLPQIHDSLEYLSRGALSSSILDEIRHFQAESTSVAW